MSLWALNGAPYPIQGPKHGRLIRAECIYVHTAPMGVSDDDRRRMARVAADLAEIETDEPASPEQLAAAVAAANRRRAARGQPPLDNEPEPPEEEFYRRARALGLRRSGR